MPDDKDNQEEDEYKDILKKIQDQALHIDKETFTSLYDWKAKRSKKYLEVERNYKLYESAFKEILDLKDEEKIKFYMKTKERSYPAFWNLLHLQFYISCIQISFLLRTLGL